MKTLAASILFAAVLPAVAQRTEITAFSAEGVITWTNETTNAYCGVEWSGSLYHTWLAHPEQGLWQFQPTTTVVSVRVLSDDFIRWADAVGQWWPGIADTIQPQFFRIVASSNLLSEPSITNHLSVINSSDSTLSNLWFNSCAGGNAFVPVTNIQALLASSSTPPVAVAAPRLQLGELNWNYVIRPDQTNAYKSWLVTWEQTGTNRHCGTSVLPFGGRDKAVTVTVYSNRVTTYYDWLGPGGTLSY